MRELSLSHGRGSGRAVLCLLMGAALVAGVCAQEAQPVNDELRFAQGLRDMGYGALAVDHLLRTRDRQWLPEKARQDAVKLLARTYGVLGRQAAVQRDYKGKREYYEKAIAAYDEHLRLAGNALPAQEKADLQYESGELCSILGHDHLLNMEGTAEEQEAADYRKDAIRWYGQAEQFLSQSADYYVKLREQLSKAVSREDKIRYRDVREQAGRIQIDRAKMLYYFAGAYSGKDEVPTRDAKLKTAVDILQNDIVQNYSIFDVKYTAQRFIGMCYQRLAQLKAPQEAKAARDQAIDNLKKALTVQQTPETQWIVWLSRYSLAQTFNDAGDYDSAMVQVDALVSDLSTAIETSGSSEELDMYLAARLEKARALVLQSRGLIARSAQYAKQDKPLLARDDAAQARRDYNYAVSVASEIATQTDSAWHRNAKVFLDQWVKDSEGVLGEAIRVAPTIHTYSSEGLKLFQAKKYFEAIEAFEAAIAAPKNTLAYMRTLLPECWYRIGMSYYYLNEQTGGAHHYYYEAALCFEQVALNYDKAAFAPDAAHVAQQLYGNIFRFTREKIEKGFEDVTQQNLIYDGSRYYRSIGLMAEKFPDDPRSRELMFQSAEIARAIGQFVQAADVYVQVREDDDHYQEARYRAPLCLYLQALKFHESERKDPPVGEIGSLLARGSELYAGHMRWFEDRRSLLGREQLVPVNGWVLRSRIGFGKMLVHDMWALSHQKAEGARQALALMDGVEQVHAPLLTAEQKLELLPEAFMVVIRAYSNLDQLPNAEQFVLKIEKDYGAKSKLTSQAASLVGYAYLQRRRDLEKKGGAEAETKLAAAKAGEFLKKALDYDPEQTLQVYLDVGGALYRAEEYDQAISILAGGLERFKIAAQPNALQFQALDGLERCHQKVAQTDPRQWSNVEKYARQLNQIQPANLDYMMDLAMSLEQQSKYDEALPYWRNAKAGAGAAKDEEFKATIHLTRCYAKAGDAERAYKIIAWALLGSRAWLGAYPERALMVEQLFNEVLKDKYPDLGKLVLDHLKADVNPLRDEHSRQVIVGLFERHWAERMNDLKPLLAQAQVELRTGG